MTTDPIPETTTADNNATLVGAPSTAAASAKAKSSCSRRYRIRHNTHRHDNLPRKKRSKRRIFTLSALVLIVAIVVAIFTIPVNAVIEGPGPTWNVLGSSSASESTSSTDSTPIISIAGTQTYAASGALRMTTVSVRGCPGYPVTTYDVISAWLSSQQTVVDRDLVCPTSMSEQEVDAANSAEMTSSQDAAIIAALLETGKITHTILTITDIANQQQAADLEDGDVLVSVTPLNGQTTNIDTYTQLKQLMATIPAGTQVTLGLERDGSSVQTTITTVSATDDAESTTGSLLGLGLKVSTDSNITATFDLQDVGGPSAGMMFALGIIDSITPENLTGGKDIAGTGTISVDGSVGAIGGIDLKMLGAAAAGSKYFLAPTDNCSEVVGHEPSGLNVYAVSTLHEAVQAVQAIAAGETSALATCDRALAK